MFVWCIHVFYQTVSEQGRGKGIETMSASSIPSVSLILSIDLGTSGCKAAVVGLDGQVLAFAFRPVDTHVIPGGGAEQNPEDWWLAFLGAAGEVLVNPGVQRQRVQAVCCSCQGEGTVAVDKSGRVLTPALLWMDMRGGAAVRRLAKGWLPAISGFDPWKLWQWVHKTGGAPALSGKDQVGHIAFIRETMPEIYAKTHRFLNVLDYMNLRLTGRMVASRDSILTTWATDNRNLGQLTLDGRLLAMGALEKEKLPEVVACTEVIGALLPSVAEQLGLSPQTRVVAGSVDNSAAAVGSGAVADNALHLYIGTSSWVGAHVAKKKTDLRHQIAAVPCALPDRYLMMAMQSSAGANVEFLRHRLLRNRGNHFGDIEALAANSPPGARGLVYLPWLFGERGPVDDPNLRATLLNMSLEHEQADVARAVFEGVALNTRWMMEPVGKFLGVAAAEITVVGGGAQSSFWCRILADVLNLSIKQPVAPIQANVRGAAFIAGVGIGEMSFADVMARVPITQSYEPDTRKRALYDDAFAGFLDAYHQLAPWYRRWQKRSAEGVSHD